MLALQSILHPTDFSRHAEVAFDVACSLARDHGARLIVLHATPPPVFAAGGLVPPAVTATHKRDLHADLHRLQPPDARIQVEHRLVEGDTVPAILAAADQIPCQLIVMGTLGRSGLGRLLMGSVAEQVVRQAWCPVLTVKLPLSDVGPSSE